MDCNGFIGAVFETQVQLISKGLKVTMRQGKDTFKTGEGRREKNSERRPPAIILHSIVG